jgi:hypothetical protein
MDTTPLSADDETLIQHASETCERSFDPNFSTVRISLRLLSERLMGLFTMV